MDKKIWNRLLAIILIICMLPWMELNTAYVYAMEETALSNMVVSGNITVTEHQQVQDLIVNTGATLNLNGYTLAVEGSVICDGKLAVNNGTLMCSQDMTVSDNGIVQMNGASDFIYVKGNLLWNSNIGTKEYLTNGRLELGGNFTVVRENSFATADMHCVIFSGSGRQEISFAGDDIYLANVENNNQSQEGIYSQKFIPIGDMTDNGTPMHYENENAVHGYRLTQNTTIDGDLLLYSGVMDLNGYELTVTGSFIQQGGTVQIGSGRLNVQKDYRIQSVHDSEDEAVYAKSFGKLVMTDSKGTLYIYGDFVDESCVDHTDLLTAGSIYAYGDVTVLDSGCENAFTPSGTHALRLCGDTDHTVTFPQSSAAGHSRLHNLYYVNSEPYFLEFVNEPYITGVFTASKKLPQNIRGYLEAGSGVNGKTFAGNVVINETVTINAATTIQGDLLLRQNILLANRKLSVGGNLYNEAENSAGFVIEMTGSSAVMEIQGNIVPVRGLTVLGGSISLYGDFTGGGYFYHNTGSFRFVGSKKQSVDVNTGSGFASVYINNTSDEGVWCERALNYVNLYGSKNKLFYKGYTGSFGYTLNRDEVIGSDLGLIGDTLNLNGHTLTVKGNFYHYLGQVMLNGGTLIVEGDYLLENPNNEDMIWGGQLSTGSIIMNRPQDKLTVGGSFVYNKYGGSHSEFSDGVLTVGKDFRAYKFTASGNHTLVLNGTERQAIQELDTMELRVQNLTLENSGGDGIVFTKSCEILGEIQSNGCKTSGVMRGGENIRPLLINHTGGIWLTCDVTMDEDCTVDGDLLLTGSSIINGSLHVAGDLTLAQAEINGAVTVEGNAEIYAVKTVTVSGNLLIAGGLSLGMGANVTVGGTGSVHIGTDMRGNSSNLRVNDGTVVVGQKIDWSEGSNNPGGYSVRVYINGERGLLKLSGDGNFGVGALSQGTIEAGGNLTCKMFNGTDGGRLILDGDKRQVLDFSKGCKADILEVKNSSEDGVLIKTNFPINNLMTNGNKVAFEDGSGVIGWTLTQDEVYEGDFVLLNGVLDLNGHTLTVNGDFTWRGGKLLMTNPDDILNVSGDFVSNIPYTKEAGTYLTDGVINVFGTQFMMTSGFLASENHTVNLCGESRQNIISQAGTNRINHLTVNNAEGVELTGEPKINGNVTGMTENISGCMKITERTTVPNGVYPCDVSFAPNKYSAAVDGDFTFMGNVTFELPVKLNGAAVVYGNAEVCTGCYFHDTQIYGTLSGTGFTFERLTVHGDFYAKELNTFSKGTLEVKGDFVCNYMAKGDNRVILSGAAKQTVSIGNGKFATLELCNDSEDGIFSYNPFAYDTLIRNGSRLVIGNSTGEFGWTLNENVILDKTLILIGGTLDLNGHTLTLNGDFIHQDGVVKINGGTLIVNGDYRLQSVKNPAGSASSYDAGLGKLILSGENDVLDINGNMYLQAGGAGQYAISAGNISVSGNITEMSALSFTTTGGNMLTLDGGTKQTVLLPGAAVAGLKIANASDKGVCIEKEFTVNTALSDVNAKADGKIAIPRLTVLEDGVFGGDLLVTGNVTFENDYVISGTVEFTHEAHLANHTLCAGNLIIRGKFYVEQGTLLIQNKITVKDLGMLMMQDENGFVSTRDFAMTSNSSHKGNLTGGTLYITGDFEQSGAVNFIASENHVTILDGEVLPSGKKRIQTIRFAHPGSCHFNILTLTRAIDEGYVFNCTFDDIYRKCEYDLKEERYPSAVSNILAIETGTVTVTLSYDCDDTKHEICGYEIYRDGCLVGITSQKTYTDTGLLPSTNYRYTIYAFDAERKKSKTSPQFSVTTAADVTAPDAVCDLSIKARTGSSATIAWSVPNDDSGVKCYTVYRNGTKIAENIETPEYTNTGLKENEEYTYEVTATDITGKESAKSNAVLTTVLAPKIVAVTSPQGTLLRGTASLKALFVNQGTTVGTTVTFQYQDLTGAWKTIASVSSGFVSGEEYHTASCAWNTTALSVDGDISVRAVIVDAQKNTSTYDCMFHVDNIVPESVEQIEAGTEGGMIDIRWAESQDADCAGYRIYRREAGGKLVLYADIEDRYETAFHDRKVVTGVSYTYVITAVDMAGNESKRSQETVVIPGNDETAPVVTEVSCKTSVIGNRGVIKIGASDNKGIERMALYYEKDGVWNLIDAKNTKSGELLVQWDTTSYEEGSYTLRARAWDAAGNVSVDENSPSFTCRLDHTGPDAVEISKTEPYPGAVRLEWEPVRDEDFAYFVVEQQNADGTYKEIYRTDYYLAYLAGGLMPETEYIFRVTAFDTLDNRGAEGKCVTIVTPADENKPGILSVNAVKDKNMLTLFVEAADDCGIDRGVFTVWAEGKTDRESFEVKAGGKTQTSLSQAVDITKYDKETLCLKYEVFDIAGNKDEVSDITFYVDNTPPAAVKNLRVTDNQGSIALEWDAAEDEDAAFYNVYRADINSGIYRRIAAELYSHSFIDSTVSVGRQYSYVVTAADTCFNESEYSNAVYGMVTDDKVKPVIRGIGPACDTVGADPRITVLATDNASLAAVVVSYRNVEDGYSHFRTIKEWTAINNNELYEEVLWNTKDLTDGGTYEIRVEAVDRSGNKAVSMSRVYTLDNTAPQKPEAQVTAGNFKAEITISEAVDDDFSHFEIRRRKLGTLEFETVAELVECTYTDTDLTPNITYYYQVIAYDIHGNTSESGIAEVVAGDTDDVAPVADTAPLIMGLAGKEVYFDASMSTDNVGITEFLWETGDGKLLNGSRCAYIYENAGSYSAKLTVCDKEGNTDTKEFIVTIRNKEDCGAAVVTVKDAAGRVLPNTFVYVMLGETEYANLTTDSLGRAQITGVDGQYTVMAYQDGYTPASCIVELSRVKNNEASLILKKSAVVQGDVTVHKLSLQELIELGVDLRKTENYHTYTFKATFVFEEKQLPQYVYITANSLGVLSVKGVENGSGAYVDGGYYWSIGGGKTYGITTVQSEGQEQPAPEPILAYLSVMESITWLKDMYQVEMQVVNCADKNFTLEHAAATINLPDGLALAAVKGGQNKTIAMGSIPGQTTGNASWVVRGNESGSYAISVDFNAALLPFYVPVKARFETKQDFAVTTGEGITIFVYPEMEAYIGKHYVVQYEIYNGSRKELYNFKTTMGSYKEEQGYGEVTVLEIDEDGNEKKTIISSLEREVEETDPVTGKTTVKTVVEKPQMHYNVTSNKCGTVSVAYGGSTYNVGVFYPGERLYGTYMTTFQNPATESDPDTVYYKLIDTVVEELRGANLGVEVVIIPVKSHINRYLHDARPVVENTYADPIDITTGAFSESKTALTVSGGKQIAFTLNYNSLLAEYAGELGYGWSHDYESGIANYNGQLVLTTGAGRQAKFLSQDMMDGVIYGSYLDDNTIQVDASRMYTGKFACVTGGMEDYSIFRNMDGTYELRTPNEDIYYYNEDGILVSMRDKNQRSVTVTRVVNTMILMDTLSRACLTLRYDDDGKIVSVKDNLGNEAVFAYAAGRLVSYTDAAGNVITYEYDMENRIVASAVNQRKTVENRYDEQGRVIWQKSGEAELALAYEDGETYHKVTLTDANGNISSHITDTHYRITSTTDGNGNTTTYAYDPKGNLLREEKPDGTQIRYQYDIAGNMTQIRAEDGSVTDMTYDMNGNITKVSDLENVQHFVYDENNRLIQKSAKNGRTETYTYGEYGYLVRDTLEKTGTVSYEFRQGRMVSSTDVMGNQNRMQYDAAGRLITTVDALGNATAYAYNAKGDNIRITNALGGTSTYEYDYNGNVTKAVDALGYVVTSTYDDAGNLTSVTDKLGNTTRYIRDGVGNIIRKEYPDGTTEQYTYDAAGNNTSITNVLGQTSTFAYDSMNRMTKSTDANGLITTYEYDKRGRLVKTTYDDGSFTADEYDIHGRVVSTRLRDGNTLKYTYDSQGNVTSITDSLNVTVQYRYDNAGRLTAVTDGNGSTTTYAYDAAGNCIGQTTPDKTHVKMTYDALGRMTSVSSVTSTYGEVSVRYEYDALGRVIKTTDETGAVTSFEYDAMDNLTAVYDGEGNKTASYTYDGAGNMLTGTDAFGNTVKNFYDTRTGQLVRMVNNVNSAAESVYTYEYDTAGRLVSSTDPLSGISTYTYDKTGNISSVTDPMGGTTTYTYDPMGRITAICNAGGSTSRYTYDENGKLSESENARGQKTKYEYDALGRVGSFADEAGTADYFYDNNGNVLSITEKLPDGTSRTISRTYDCMNRVSSYTDYKGNTIQYGYDELGNIITLTYAGGEIVRYAYYPNGLLKSVTDVKGNITSYEYDSRGNVTKTVFADETVENCTYDARGFVTVQETTNAAGTLLSRYEYTYDERGNVVTATGTDCGDTGKIAEAVYKYDAANRLISYNGKEVQYDKDGNMTYGPLDGKMVQYEYDCRNRLVKAGDTEYEYDAENNRTAVETAEYREEYLVNSNASLSQILTATRYEKGHSGRAGSGNSGTVTVYTYGNGLVSQYTEENDTEYYHYNNIGSTMYLTRNGVKTHEFAYSTYGELTKGEYGEVRFMYNGRLGVMTDSNGLYYMRARYYNPEIRRFINQDVVTGSIENSQSLNRYAYCQGNPVNYFDPFGLAPQSFGSWAGHTILNLLSFVPVFGNAADAFNAVWYLYEGNYAEAIACAVGAIII